MDFNDTPEQAAYRAEVRAWLSANAAPRKDRPSVSRRLDAEEGLILAKKWQNKKAEAGYACRHWPTEHGGQGRPMLETIIYDQEETHFDVPTGFFSIGLGMCGPIMAKYATEEQQSRYIPPMMRGQEVWCQLFSEPAAGSDIAGLRTRCHRDGDDWVVNGQKAWTSGAHYSDYGILVARHDSSLPKHKGLTFFFIDMKSPGIDVKPIKQINGGSNFNEVFFTNVRVPDGQRLGAIGEGWQVAIATLMNERLAVGDAPPPDFREVMKLAASCLLDGRPAIDDSAVREKIADWYVESMGMKHTKARMLTALSQGRIPGPENSIGKLVSASKLQNVSSFGADLMDMGGVITDPSLMPASALFQQSYLYSPGLRIAGGTDEILRNIIAERVLGLPGEIRVDRDVPYNDIPTGS